MQTNGGTSGQPGTGKVLLPPNQAGVAQTWQDLFTPMNTVAQGAFADPYSSAAEALPAGWAYPRSQADTLVGDSHLHNFLTGDVNGTGPSWFRDATTRGTQTAIDASDWYKDGVYSAFRPVPGQMLDASRVGVPYLGQTLSQAFDPRYGQQITDAQGTGAQMNQAGTDLLASGFDPQSALYNRGTQRLTDRSAVSNAMSGLGSSPYGAGVTANALGNYDIDWQNNQLDRQNKASTGAGSAFTTGYQLPANALAARDQAALRGASGYGSLLNSTNAGMTGASSLGYTLEQNLANMGMLPYSTGATIGNNGLAALGNQGNLYNTSTNIGNNKYLLPQQLIQDAAQYMGLGQSASSIAGNLQNQGFNQTAAGIGGALSGANSLFGGNGLLSSGSGGGGLFSSGGLLGGVSDFGGGGLATTGVADVLGPGLGAEAALGSEAAKAAPLAFSDRRLKEDIARIGELDNGLPIYSFRYLGSRIPQAGLMADEVERLYPDAVLRGPFGFKIVDYAKAAA